jgi:PAS domain S-box-containing protein
MPAAEIFLSGAILLQIVAATMAFKLIRITGRSLAWIMISIALFLMALRRIIPLARSLSGDISTQPDTLNEFIGLLLSGFMTAGIFLIGPIFRKIFRSERELKESEQRFRSYFELPLVGVAIASSDKRWITVNDRLCEILGASRQELVSKNMDELTFPEDLERERALGRSVSEGRAEGYSLDKRFTLNGSGFVWTSQAIRCVRDAKGNPSYFVVILQDITERKKSEEGLRNSVSEKEALLRELYHRTKNNMQMICSLLNLESSQFDDPRVTEEFHLIGNKIISMSLVHEMLYVSRDLSSIDLSDYIEDLCRLLSQSYLANSDDIGFEIRLEHVRVPIDTAIPLGLILNELITNALKHAFPAGRKGRIRVAVTRNESSSRILELVISDDGIGVPPGFDFKGAHSMGFKTIYALAEQLGGTALFSADQGVECRVPFNVSDDQPRLASPSRDEAQI